jgi:hypothetical protein
VPHGPDFLRRLVALIRSMRLSLMKGAHADLSSTAWQEIGVKPGFGLSGIPLLFPSDSRFIRRTLRSTSVVSHISGKRARCPDFLYAVPSNVRVCGFH